MANKIVETIGWLFSGSNTSEGSNEKQTTTIETISQQSLTTQKSTDKLSDEIDVTVLKLENANPNIVKVDEAFVNIATQNNSWTGIDVKNNFQSLPGNNGPVQSFYTDFKKHIFLKDSITVGESSVFIQTASYYGARPWNQSYWFSGFTGNDVGLLSVPNAFTGQSTYYPLPGLSEQNILPLLVPSHSVTGEKGYACVFESNLGLLGFSLWDINKPTPEKLFSQTGYESIFFLGDKHVIAFREDIHAFEFWDLQSKERLYRLQGWWQQSDFYISFRPYNSVNQILLAANGNYIYGFDLIKEKCAFTLNLKGEPNGIGVFHRVLVGDDLFFCREFSSPHVNVFDIKTGEMKYNFVVGGAIDDVDSDDYPMCVHGNSIIGLQNDDRLLVNLWDAASGKMIQSFKGATQYITGVFCTETRLIAHCDANATTNKDARDMVLIWDIKTTKLLETITAPLGYKMSPQDITGGKLTLFVDKINENKKDNCTNLELDKKAKKKPLEQRAPAQSFQWTYPFFRELLNNSIQLDVWCTESCTFVGSIRETFIPPTMDFPVVASYTEKQLIVDNSNSVLVQNYRIK